LVLLIETVLRSCLPFPDRQTNKQTNQSIKIHLLFFVGTGKIFKIIQQMQEKKLLNTEILIWLRDDYRI